jgi:hypothetical protein
MIDSEKEWKKIHAMEGIQTRDGVIESPHH